MLEGGASNQSLWEKQKAEQGEEDIRTASVHVATGHLTKDQSRLRLEVAAKRNEGQECCRHFRLFVNQRI